MCGLEEGVFVADIARWRHAHAADQGCDEVGQDIAKHVFSDEHVISPRLHHEVERHRIHVGAVGFHAGIFRRMLFKNLAPKSHRGEHIGFIDVGDSPCAAFAGGALLGELESKFTHAGGAMARDFLRVIRDFIAFHLTPASCVKQTFGGFAH